MAAVVPLHTISLPTAIPSGPKVAIGTIFRAFKMILIVGSEWIVAVRVTVIWIVAVRVPMIAMVLTSWPMMGSYVGGKGGSYRRNTIMGKVDTVFG